jgi:pimeloyl-ACP methyl ester carboxylesterase
MMNSTTNTVVSEVSSKYGTEKPIALYLPGLDGFGISAATWQFNDLSNVFELWRMSVAIEDRSSFGDLVKHAAEFIDEVARSTSRPIYVIGESFGGLLTPAVALRLQSRGKREGTPNPIKGMVLVNPATSFDNSNWDVLAPILTNLDKFTKGASSSSENPSPYAVLGSLVLSALVPSRGQTQQLGQTIANMATTRDPTKLQQTMADTLDSFQLTADMLPSDLLAHRISKWLMVGSSLVNPRLHTLELPTLLVAGQDDKLLDSRREMKRLEKLLHQSEKLLVSGAGHFVLDDRVNLTEAILYSKLDPLKRKNKKFDPILDWKLPPPEIIEQQYNSSVKPLADAFSPVFISTDSDGTRHMGLDNLPEERPLLFVSNHQLCKFLTVK